MKAYEKINHAITFVLPDSATKVFNFVNDLFNQDLDPEFFKQKFWDYNAAEQYFICYYLGIYFDSSDRYTFYNKWLSEQEKIYSDSDEYDAFLDRKYRLDINKGRLSNVLLNYTPTAERRMKQLKKHKVPYVDYQNSFKDELLDYRIPLYKVDYKEFKEFFIVALKEIISQKQAEQIFFNSFAFGNNIYPIELLYVEVDKLTLLKEQISLVKKYYDENFRYQIESKIVKHNKAIDDLPANKRAFYQKISESNSIGLSFAAIMYNAFPEIRDKQKNKELEKYLENLASNIVIR
jgi:hypothetical protein